MVTALHHVNVTVPAELEAVAKEFYQSVLGIWPLAPPSAEERAILVERLQGYMQKAVHEAKQRTSWINPSRAYDEAVRDFVAQTLRDSPQNRVVAEIQSFLDRILDAAQYNSLAQVVLIALGVGVIAWAESELH